MEPGGTKKCCAVSHDECLAKWIETSGNTKCEICHTPYVIDEPPDGKCITLSAASVLSFFVLGCALILGKTPEYTLLSVNAVQSICTVIWRDSLPQDAFVPLVYVNFITVCALHFLCVMTQQNYTGVNINIGVDLIVIQFYIIVATTGMWLLSAICSFFMYLHNRPQ